ncbi:hypothetical protein OMP95_10890 [Methylophaga sp. OBS4]|nr:hypothetical protein [Methylophaga sp. OBS4]
MAILNNVFDFMEEKGVNRKAVSFGIDEELVNEVYEATGVQYSLNELQKAADKCLAHEWIEHTTLGDKYTSLRVTEKGIGIVRSKRKQEAEKNNRPVLKKVSDYIEEHKGLFVFLGFTVALASLLIKIYGDK